VSGYAVGMSSKGWAVCVLALLLLVLGVLTATLVPWRESPAPRADQLAALKSLPPAQVARGVRFHRDLRPAGYGSMLVSLVVALVLGLTPLGARIVGAMGSSWIAQALGGGLVIVFIGSLLTLPFAAWSHAVVHRYGLSTQGWGPWLVDVVKGYAVTAVIGAIALFGFYGVVKLSPGRWWAWGAAGAAGLAVLLSFVFPVLVEPIFNHFTPLPDGPLRTSLIAMADRDGVPVKDVLVADASRRTKAVNAYVSGFGATRRIVIYDTLLDQATPGEVESVVAHELGHAKDNDVLTGTVIGALGAAAAVIAVFLLGSWIGLLRRAGVTDIGEPRAIALLLAVAAVAGLVAAPLGNLVSRQIEARADTHALRLTDDPATFEQMQAKLAQVNIADVDPGWFAYGMFANHPSTVQRMAAAIAYAQGAR
jgi:STE24 endopeptidase